MKVEIAVYVDGSLMLREPYPDITGRGGNSQRGAWIGGLVYKATEKAKRVRDAYERARR